MSSLYSRNRSAHPAVIVGVVVAALSGPAYAQDKPRVFVQGKGSDNVVTSGSGNWGRHWGAWGSNSTHDSHDEGMEVTKDLQNNCPTVGVTLNESAADYVVWLNRESKHNRGVLRTNSQLQVANRAGDVIGSNATRTVGHAAKDACELIVADWRVHGRLNVPFSAAAGAPAISPSTVESAENEPQGTLSDRQDFAPAQSEQVQSVSGGNGALRESRASASAPKGIIVRFTSTPPKAEVDVDGEYWGTTPTSDLTRLSEGEHIVTVRKVGYQKWERKISLAAGEDRTIAAELTLEGNDGRKPRIVGLD